MRAPKEMPTFDALFEPLLAALRALGGSGNVEEIHAKTIEVAGISEDVASQMHDPDKSNMTEVGYRLTWARTYLRKYGLIDNSSRGVWSLTAKGSSANKIDPAAIVKAVRNMDRPESSQRGKKSERAPLTGTQVMSTVATGGGGGIFQARVGALYLANLLTGLPTAFCLHGCRVETVRFEARYTGVHTDDVYCQISRSGTTWHQFIQCKRGLNATAGDTDFIDSLQGAWRDFLRVDGTPFVRGQDVLVIATNAPATPANQAAKRLCELSRASVDLDDFLQKLESKLFNRKHKDTWAAFKTVSQNTLGEKYTEVLVFELLQHLRVDIHDLANDSSQELSLVQALLTSGQPGDSGEAVWDGLFAYVQEHGISVGSLLQHPGKCSDVSGGAPSHRGKVKA